MKKLREFLLAKLIARILFVASGIGCVLLGICFFIGVSENLTDKTRYEVLKNVYENINERYSMEAAKHFIAGKSHYKEYLRENNFKYGIIKSDNLDKIDFREHNSYQETNMTDDELATVEPEQLYLCKIVEDGNGFLNNIETGYYKSDMNNDVLDEKNAVQLQYYYADRICYDLAKGIIYYRAEGNYYPVQNVSLCYEVQNKQTVYNYVYDFTNKVYQLISKNAVENIPWVEEPITESSVFDKIQDTDPLVAEILGEPGNFVNLADLNNTIFSYHNWGTILLDNIRSIRGDELTIIDSNSLSGSLFINQPQYYLNEDFTLVVEEEVSMENYWVVSIVPNFVPASIMNNEYSQKGWIVQFYFDMTDTNFAQRLGGNIFVMILSFAFLIYAAGHRRGVNGVVLTLFDRIPIDIFSIIIFIVEMVLVFMLMYTMNMTELLKYVLACIGLLIAFGVIMAAIALEYILSLCVRLKAGKWWRNSICYQVYHWCCDGFVYLLKNVTLIWKTIFIFGVISVVEFFILIIFSKNVIYQFWLIEKVIFCVVLCLLVVQFYTLQKASQNMAEGNLLYKIDVGKMFWECKKHGENLNRINEGMSRAVDERIRSEHLKTELITNVSHDIKTPLTSIINYVDLLSKEELHNDKAAEYLEVLDRQSSKLKKLIEDLVEASKASSGNMSVDSQQLEAGVFLAQTVGEFEEKLKAAGLELIVSKLEETVYIMADGRHVWRVIDNLMNNICKYAQPGSRVYINLEATNMLVNITFRNISKFPLNISGEELMERFVRGDKSRNTEGHGLGLSIAQSLMKLNEGDMKIVVDGDLFKVILVFDRHLVNLEESEYSLT
ncbi:MAG: HAMP domain-containing sensor histidine kinase [Lachnospiraceae bacterium]|nr:HAMP domain-containing sensor histidine kinase [Lachnospiraceae bacterium]